MIIARKYLIKSWSSQEIAESRENNRFWWQVLAYIFQNFIKAYWYDFSNLGHILLGEKFHYNDNLGVANQNNEFWCFCGLLALGLCWPVLVFLLAIVFFVDFGSVWWRMDVGLHLDADVWFLILRSKSNWNKIYQNYSMLQSWNKYWPSSSWDWRQASLGYRKL